MHDIEIPVSPAGEAAMQRMLQAKRLNGSPTSPDFALRRRSVNPTPAERRQKLDLSRFDCSPEELESRRRQREIDAKWRESVRRQHRQMDIAAVRDQAEREWAEIRKILSEEGDEDAVCDRYEHAASEWHRRYDHLYPKRAALVKSENVVPLHAPGSIPLPSNVLTGPRDDFIPADAEDALALDFVSQHVDDLRYVGEFGKWMRWDGQKWREDKTASGYDLIRKFVRQMAFRSASIEAKKLATAQKVAAVERLARTDQRIAVTADEWDANPMLLNTPAGVVDLNTGIVHLSAPAFLMTKITAVAPGGDCPTWLAFLNRSLAGDAELIAFIQRMLGYALTGETREHALFFLFGPGGNGKGVLLNTVAGILGDYAKTSPIETFTDSAHERHPTDLAGLRGARLVTASETERGRRWAEAKIKMLTGGDRISARFMRQDFFEFMPQFKLVISGNHKPGLQSVDDAIRRRLHLIPFTVKIPPQERDTALPEKLKAEWPGILAWMIEGCLAWQRDGLRPPAAVRAATDDYLMGEDAMGTWLDERCERDPAGFTGRQDLFASWTRWAEQAREPVGTLKSFLETMRQREFEEHKRNGVRGFRGVRLRDIPQQLPPCPIPRPPS